MMKKTSQKNPETAKRQKLEKGFRSPSRAVSAEKKCQDLFDLTSDLIQIFKPEGALLDVNLAWKRVLEYGDGDLANLSVFNVIHFKDRKESEEVFNAVFRDGKTRKLLVTFLTQSGEEVAVEGMIGALFCEDDKPCALRGIFQDVTRYQKYEELKDEFVSTVSHELRTPLTVVREGIAQMRDGLVGELTQEQDSFLDMVLRNAERLARIIEELLDVSRLEAGKVRLHRSLCNIVDVAKKVVDNFQIVAQQKKVELKTESEKERIDIPIDRDKIIQVLTNFVGNSLKFTPQGHVKIQIRDLGDFVECRVADTGRGISQEDLPRVFEKFRQFERAAGPGNKGAGLGLAISKKLIELHHGRVTIESFPLKGTTVTFLLPRYAHRDLFRESIKQAMNRCLEEGGTLSVIVFDIINYNVMREQLGDKQAVKIVVKMEELLNEALRRVMDVAIKDTRSILVLLPDTKKENACIALDRLYRMLKEYLMKEEPMSTIEIGSSVACFPEEADTIEKMLDKICESYGAP